jgi:uncharacterized integral membrane protein
MRYVRYLIYLVLAVVGVSLALANRGFVTVRAKPQEVADLPLFEPLPNEFSAPLFMVMFGCILLGLLIGMLLELIRESDHRRAEREYKREARQLKREVGRLSQKAGEQDDDILGIRH